MSRWVIYDFSETGHHRLIATAGGDQSSFAPRGTVYVRGAMAHMFAFSARLVYGINSLEKGISFCAET